jgi:UDP-2,3-diacylglucosamine hydrolase
VIDFVSDLHLCPQRPGATRIFLAYLAGRAREAEALFILGDLFEVWSGDDCIDDTDDVYHREIVAALRALSASGTRLSIMHGNRDFLIGEHFAERCGAALVSDPYVLSTQGWQFVLSHGDTLCTDDKDYLAFRAQVRTPAWAANFLAKPLAERRAIAAALRAQSETAKREKRTQELMDVNALATDDFIRAKGYATLIHGHTHRPATHAHLVDGIAVERWVLADWSEERGEILVWDGEKLAREALR